jgi:hypothetical protein
MQQFIVLNNFSPPALSSKDSTEADSSGARRVPSFARLLGAALGVGLIAATFAAAAVLSPKHPSARFAPWGHVWAEREVAPWADRVGP